MEHTFIGKWVTNSEFANLKPRNVFHKQLDKVDLPCDEHRNRHILFRKKFCCDNLCDNALIYISADDYYKLYIKAFKQAYVLPNIFDDCLGTSCSIRNSACITKIYYIFIWQKLLQLTHGRKTAEAAVKKADGGCGSHRRSPAPSDSSFSFCTPFSSFSSREFDGFSPAESQ